MKKLRTFLEKNSAGKKVLLLFVLTNLVDTAMLLVRIPHNYDYAGI